MKRRGVGGRVVAAAIFISKHFCCLCQVQRSGLISYHHKDFSFFSPFISFFFSFWTGDCSRLRSFSTVDDESMRFGVYRAELDH